MENNSRGKTISLTIFGLLVGIVLYLIGSNVKTAITENTRNSTLENSRLRSWGLNAYGQLGKEGNNANEPTPFTLDAGIKDFATGRSHTILLDSEGRIWTWGENTYGQLGRQTQFTFHAVPTLIPDMGNVKAIATNNHHAAAVKEDGTVWTWGSNYTGQLGDGTNAGRSNPAKVEGLEDVIQIASGYKFILALKKDGTVWGWGTSCDAVVKDDALNWWTVLQNNINSLEGGYYDPAGDSYEVFDQREDCVNEEIIGIQSKVPKKIEGLEDVEQMSGGYGHALVLKKDGTVWSFGCNRYGQLGNGGIRNVETNSVPRKIEGLEQIEKVSAGFRHSLALKKDGTVWGWGHNEFGEIGQGRDIKENPLPAKIENFGEVKEIIAGYDFSLAVKKDDTLWGWGKNGYGLIDKDGVLINHVPMQVKGLDKVEKVRAGGAHIIAEIKNK